MRKFLRVQKGFYLTTNLNAFHTLPNSEQLHIPDSTTEEYLTSPINPIAPLSPTSSLDSQSTYVTATVEDQEMSTQRPHRAKSFHPPTKGSIAHKHQELTLDFTSYSESKYFYHFKNLLPGIHRFTLRELNLKEVVNNAQLRHDLYFDADLQFKPNTEGNDVGTKRETTEAYWLVVTEEIKAQSFYRVPLLIFEARETLIELLSHSDETIDEVKRNVDVALIKQELDHGIFDGVLLAAYLAGVIKKSCAPARDGMVDDMVEKAKEGDFGGCLRSLYSVLEVMKLVSF